MKTFFLALILTITLQSSSAMNCSSMVKVESRGLLNYLGRITFTAPKNFDGQWTMEMDTDVPFTFLGGWSIWVISDPEEGHATFKSRDKNLTLIENEEVTFRFRISWFKNEPKPEVINLKWEDVDICQPTGKSVDEVKQSRRRRTLNQSSMQGRRRMKVNK